MNRKPRFSSLWKLYTVLLGLLAFWGYYEQGLPRIWDLVDFLVFLITYAGLVSFSWRQPLFSRRFWQVFWPICIVWNIVDLYVIPVPDPQDWDAATLVTAATISLVILIPTFVALFLYAFRRARW